MAQIPYGELQIISLTKGHELSSFNSTSEELNDFLKNHAQTDQDALISKSYLCYWKENLVGFVSLAADTLDVKVVDQGDGCDCGYQKYPCMKIARLAVDRKFVRNGIGSFLLLASIGKAISVSNEIGCRYITVDSKTDAISFYEKHNFKIVEMYKNKEFPKMYLNMHPIVAAMRPTETLNGF